MRNLLSALLLVPLSIQAQYNGPESVEHDAEGQRYFVSNTGNSSISQQAYDGTVMPFVTNLPTAPYGLELKGDTLFACVSGSIRGFSTVDGVEVFSLNLGAAFLNGITTDGAFLYATDFNAKKIFKVNVEALTYTTLVANTVTKPNGIVWDAAMDRLWVVNWGANAPIKGYDRNTGAELSSFATALTNIDGVTLDCDDGLLVSSWTPAQITRFEKTFTLPGYMMPISGLSNPADLDFDVVHDRICIPNSGSNTVVFSDMDCSSTHIQGNEQFRSFDLWPNPTDGLLKVGLKLQAAMPFLVFNVRGALVASGTLTPNSLLDMTELAPGTYLVEVPVLRRSTKVVRY